MQEVNRSGFVASNPDGNVLLILLTVISIIHVFIEELDHRFAYPNWIESLKSYGSKEKRSRKNFLTYQFLILEDHLGITFHSFYFHISHLTETSINYGSKTFPLEEFACATLFHRHKLPGSKLCPKFFRCNGVNGGQN